MSPREKVWVHKTSLTPPPFIEVSVQRGESEQSCICVLDVSILPLFSWIVEMFRQCDLFCVIIVMIYFSLLNIRI